MVGVTTAFAIPEAAIADIWQSVIEQGIGSLDLPSDQIYSQ